MNTQTHEQATKGGTSASNAAADRLCPGRHQAQKGLPEIQSDAAASGTKIHAALAQTNRAEGTNDIVLTLTSDERDMFDACREVEKSTIAQIWNGEPDQNNRVWREERYWCRVPNEGGHYLHSGQADMVMRRKNTVLILDYKTGAGDVAESPRNEQLRDLAVMVGRSLVVEDVVVAIVQPLETWTPELCRYDKAALEQAEKEMWERVRASNAPNAPRVAGEVQCKFCRAKMTCPQNLAWRSALVPEPDSPLKVFPQDWTPAQRSMVAANIPVLRKMLDDYEDFLKQLLKSDPESVPGFHLKEGQERSTINDPQELFNRFTALGGQIEQYMAAVKITKGEFEEQVRAVTKLKGKHLKTKIEELLHGITTTSQNQPSLSKIAR